MKSSGITRGVRAVALVEGAKGAVVYLAGFGLFALIHRNLHDLAESLVLHLHLNPAREYPRIFIDAASKLTDSRLWTLAGLAFAYATCRMIEAYGLWRERAWAEWFALVSGAIYIPFEIYELVEGVSWIKVLALVINLGVVAWIGYALYVTKLRVAPPA